MRPRARVNHRTLRAPRLAARGLGAAIAALVALACSASNGSPVPAGVPAEGTAENAPGVTGRVVLDVRDPELFGAGHVAGALNLQLGWEQLEGRVHAYVGDTATPLAVHARDPGSARSALAVLAKAGYTNVVLIEPDDTSATLASMTAAELRTRLAGESPPVVIDVRTKAEWGTGVIEGALRVDQDAAPALLERLERGKEYAVICEGGYRSAQLASLMQREGFERVANVIDGMAAWRRLAGE